MQDAVKKETSIMAAGCAGGCILLIAAFAVLHRFLPEIVPFDFKVILSSILGFAVAAGNFFWMALTVQKVASMENEEAARSTMGASYRYRTAGQLLWAVLALVLPVFNGAAGIIPLFFPSALIKIRGILSVRKGG